ncbi:MAG: MBL fold metallo-hydrolase [Verrucomicrobiae bacterium]|nr:MBL fold metallo-hydrolase [Verrucomicrobiae bacterium]
MASFLVDGRILVDTGWCNVLKMLEQGLNPLNIEYLIFTHMHHDHYLGLPQLLFYLACRKILGVYKPPRPLTIIGPSKQLRKIVATSQALLQIRRYPELAIALQIVSLKPGATFKGAGFVLETMAAKHSSGGKLREEALTCKYTDTALAKSFVFTGDTSFHPPIAAFAKNTPLLIHDACHTSPGDAAVVAKSARAGKLYLIHGSNRVRSLKAARKVFKNSFWAEDGKRVEF